MSTRPSKIPKRTVLESLPFQLNDKKIPRGLRLFGTQLDRVRTALATPVVPTARGVESLRGHVLYKANLRTPMFMLQGLTRVALGTGGDKQVFESIHADVKVIEDLSGDIDFWWAMGEKSSEWQLPEAFTAYASDRHRTAAGRLVGWLEARTWIDHRSQPEEGSVRLRVNRIGRDLEKLEWPSVRKEQKNLAKFFHETFLAVEAKSHTLDMNDLEQGLHELRRRIRWLSIYPAALDGAIQLDAKAKPPRNWSRYLTQAVVNNPFNVLPKADKSIKPLRIPAPLFYAMSWLIAELGALKDRAQWTETVTHGLEVLGIKSKRPLGDLTLEARDAGKAAKILVEKTLVQDRLLLRLAEAIEKQR
jgi:hypothetical protein